MGNAPSARKINFEDMQDAMKDDKSVIISTLPESMQRCLIVGTIPASEEVQILNTILSEGGSRPIVVYGMNAADDSIVSKYNQLVSLGYANVRVYPGGMFEWLLLQDIYGSDTFRTTTAELDILRYKGKKNGSVLMLTR